MNEKVVLKLTETIDMLTELRDMLTKEDKPSAKKEPKTPVKEEAQEENNAVILIGEKEYDLQKMSVKAIKKLAMDEFEIEFDSSDKDTIIADFVEYIADVLGELEVADEEELEEEEEELEEENSLLDTLNELSEKELKEILESAEMSTKGKKQALIDRIVEAVEAGEIEFDDDDEEELEEEELEEEELEEEESEDEEEDERGPEIVSAEDEVEEEIRKKVAKGTLKMPKIKEFLKKYYDGDADCSDCSKCSKDDILDCYIRINRNLVDDDAVAHEMEDPYVRNGENCCCGTVLKELDNNNMYCEVCGAEYCEED